MKDTGERLIPEGHTKSLTYGEHLSRYLSVLPLTKEKVVLDIASGTGYGTQLISHSAKKVYGVDYSSAAINYAKKHYGAKNTEYIKGDALAIPLPDKSIDVVVSLETIEHLKSPATFIKEVKRVLKKDGQFIVSTPNDDEFIEGNNFHLHEFTLTELKKLINDNFKKSTFYYQGTYFSAALLSENTFSKGGKWKAVIEKTFPQKLPKAIYYLAVASDARVGKLSKTVTLADTWSTKEDIIRDSGRRKELQQLQQDRQRENEHWAGEHKKISDELRKTAEELSQIKTSKSWKVIKSVRKMKPHNKN